MKLVCTIGTQGLSDGRRILRGEMYEVDDDTASTLIAHRYAEVVVDDNADAASVAAAVPEVVVDDSSTTGSSSKQKRTRR